mgnify:CR=1 FL=1
MNLVIDTNIFISALIKESTIRKIILDSEHIFLFPEYEFQEIYKNKDEILEKSGYSEIEFIRIISILLNKMKIINYEEICNYYDEAFHIMHKIDSDDIIFIATAIAFDCPIWSDDKHFKQQNQIKTLTTKEILELINKHN